MTVEEAEKKLYPNSYVMVNCELHLGIPVAGEVVAYAPMKNNDGELCQLADNLILSGDYGSVILEMTADPLDGGSLLVGWNGTYLLTDIDMLSDMDYG